MTTTRQWLLVTSCLLLVARLRAQCPLRCACQSNEVQCVSANYTSIPRHLATHASITTLDLSGNLINHVTYSSLTSLRSLVNLKLKNNDITSIDDGSFQTMSQLQLLDLSSNHVSAVTEQTLYGVDALMHLDLSYNNLRHVDGAFKGLTQLSRLDLRFNHIQRITQITFRDLQNLRYLFLANNQIAHIDKRAFRQMTKLMYLVLKGNPLYQLPKFEFNSQYLSYIDMSECKLSDVPRGLPSSVRYLQLRRNNISDVDGRAFRDCRFVSILVLDENGLTTIDDDTFAAMLHLQQLWLNGNRLTAIPTSLPVTLERLLMDQNHVTSIDLELQGQVNLDTVSLMGNSIVRVQYNSFGTLQNLGSLDLSNNQIEHIYGNMFENNTALHTLLLSKNPIQYMHSQALWGLHKLRSLSLAFIDNHIYIHDDVMRDLQQLQTLDLNSSPFLIKTIISRAVLTSNLLSLETLNIENSELTTLHESFLVRFENLALVRLSSSAWHCDTNLMWLRDWLRQPTSVRIETAVADDVTTCYSPRRVHGRPLLSLSDDEFVQATTTNHDSSQTSSFKPVFTTFTTHNPVQPDSESVRTVSTTQSAVPVRTSSVASSDHDDESVDGVNDHHSPPDDTEPFYIDPDYLDFDYHNMDAADPNERRHVDPFKELFNKSRPHSNNNDGEWRSNDRRTHFKDTTSRPQVHSSRQEPRDPGGGGGGGAMLDHVTLIIVIVSIATAIIASIIIAFIIYFVRKQKRMKQQQTPQHKTTVYKNGVQTTPRHDVLYFMPNGVSTQAASDSGGLAPPSERHSLTDSVRTSSSAKSKATTTGKPASAAAAAEQMTLIPGRDINHEGPMRVYKWEDF